MKKLNIFKIISLIFILFSTFSFTDCKKSENPQRLNEVVVYTYDSFAGEWGPGAELTKRFEEKTGLKLTLVDCGDAIQAYSKIVAEKNHVKADVLLGLDNILASSAKKADVLAKYTPAHSETIISKNIQDDLDTEGYITAFDYSHFAIIYDSESNIKEPNSLEDLTKDIYRKKIIVMDPRTSTPGLGFLAWIVACYADKASDYWKALEPNILSIAPSWSAGWGMFMNGEAPLCLSYTTSPAYNVEYENNHRFKTLVFPQGHILQVEGFALLKNAPNEKGAKLFMDFMISKEAQEVLPLTQWMYPVNNQVVFPESYKVAAPIPATTLSIDTEKTNELLKVLFPSVNE